MQAWEENVLEQQKAREEGRLEGRLDEQRKAIQIFISEFLEENVSSDRILAKLQKNYGLTLEQAEEYYRTANNWN